MDAMTAQRREFFLWARMPSAKAFIDEPRRLLAEQYEREIAAVVKNGGKNMRTRVNYLRQMARAAGVAS